MNMMLCSNNILLLLLLEVAVPLEVEGEGTAKGLLLEGWLFSCFMFVLVVVVMFGDIFMVGFDDISYMSKP